MYSKEKKENRNINFKESFEISASRYGESVSPKCGRVGLWPTYYFQNRKSSIVWISKEGEEFWVSCQTSSRSTRRPFDVAMWLQREEVIK